MIHAAGKRNQKILIRRRFDIPVGFSDVDPEYSKGFYKWAKVTQPNSATYFNSIQTENVITHYFEIIANDRVPISIDYEIVWNGSIYKIKRCRWLDHSKKYLLLECEENGTNE